jgi:RNA polymerase sigma-70 factor (ECF subfamily)
MGVVSDENANLILSEAGFERALDAVMPAALLVAIEGRMSVALRRCCSPEDVLQEALLAAWRDRGAHEWRGLRAFRSWLLKVIDNRIHDLADRANAKKRGAARQDVAPTQTDDGWRAIDNLVVRSTTPSRIAIYNEQAAAMRAALDTLPDELRDVVRLRLFDQLSLDEIAARLGIGESAVRHRFRKGAELYEARVRAELASRSEAISQLTRRCEVEKSSSNL